MKKEFVSDAEFFLQQTNILKSPVVRSVGIEKIEIIDKEQVYNMEVAENHNFAVNGGYIVHNCMDATRYFVKTTNLVKPGRFMN